MPKASNEATVSLALVGYSLSCLQSLVRANWMLLQWLLGFMRTKHMNILASTYNTHYNVLLLLLVVVVC